jgi:hypothetical protein
MGYTGTVMACAFSPDGRSIALGDWLGQVLVISVENIGLSAPIYTPVRIALSEPGKNNLRWDGSISTTCYWCGKRFAAAEEVLDAIGTHRHDVSLLPEESLDLGLLPDAWDDPRLLSECPRCHQPLRYNPFIVDNRDQT